LEIAELIACKLVSIWWYDAGTQFSLWRKLYVKRPHGVGRKLWFAWASHQQHCHQRIGIWRTCPSQSSPSDKQDECEYISIDRLFVKKSSNILHFYFA
jgi:hypothetical protein